MKCPLCNELMSEGGIVTNGDSVSWFSKEEYDKKRRFTFKAGKQIGKTNYLLGLTRIDNAFYCETCNKVVGVFDTKES